MTEEEEKEFTDLFDDNHDGEMHSYTHQVIFWINELLKKRADSLPEKKSVEELRAVMGNAFMDLSVQVAFKEGYNQAIKEMKTKVPK